MPPPAPPPAVRRGLRPTHTAGGLKVGRSGREASCGINTRAGCLRMLEVLQAGPHGIACTPRCHRSPVSAALLLKACGVCAVACQREVFGVSQDPPSQNPAATASGLALSPPALHSLRLDGPHPTPRGAHPTPQPCWSQPADWPPARQSSPPPPPAPCAPPQSPCRQSQPSEAAAGP